MFTEKKINLALISLFKANSKWKKFFFLRSVDFREKEQAAETNVRYGKCEKSSTTLSQHTKYRLRCKFFHASELPKRKWKGFWVQAVTREENKMTKRKKKKRAMFYECICLFVTTQSRKLYEKFTVFSILLRALATAPALLPLYCIKFCHLCAFHCPANWMYA